MLSIKRRCPTAIEVLIVYGVSLAYIVGFGKFVVHPEPRLVDLIFPVGLGAVPVVFAKLRGLTLSAVFPFIPVSRKHIIRALFLVPVVLVLLASISRLFSPVIPVKEGVSHRSLTQVFSKGYFYAFLSIVLLPAVSEEVLCRGFILSGLRAVLGKWESILLCSVLFAALHLQLIRIPFAFLPGLAISYVAWESRSLILPIGMHFLHNGILFCILMATNGLPGSCAISFVNIFSP